MMEFECGELPFVVQISATRTFADFDVTADALPMNAAQLLEGEVKVEIADDFSALMAMNVSNTLALGTLMDWLCEKGVIPRSELIDLLRRRRMSFQHLQDDGHAFAFEALEEALQSPRGHQERGSIRLVWDRDSEARCS